MKGGYIFLVVRFLVVLRVRFPGSYIPDRIRSGETQSVEFKNSYQVLPPLLVILLDNEPVKEYNLNSTCLCFTGIELCYIIKNQTYILCP